MIDKNQIKKVSVAIITMIIFVVLFILEFVFKLNIDNE